MSLAMAKTLPDRTRGGISGSEPIAVADSVGTYVFIVTSARMGCPNTRVKDCIRIISVIGASHLCWRNMSMHFGLTTYVGRTLAQVAFLGAPLEGLLFVIVPARLEIVRDVQTRWKEEAIFSTATST